ncbi:MAG: polysaccharide deacetylase family protein [Candidatus Hydrogenedentes bacterium]|nr:polysaccharide deacetylase family protein [Candidatus Hydrogenedentota bacterium]
MATAPLKHALKRGVKHGARVLGTLRRSGSGQTRILTYHSVGARGHEMNVRPEDFAAQMEWLAAHAEVIPLRDAVFGRPGVALSFDDGFADNLLHAAPILVKHAFPATVFMIAGSAGACFPAGSGNEADRILDWPQLRELAAMGIEIGAHTLTHPRLSQCSVAQQREEIGGSKKRIEDELQAAVHSFAYPYGSRLDYTQETVGFVNGAGFRCAVSNCYGPASRDRVPFEQRRIWIDRTDTLAQFQDKVTGTLDLLSVQDSALGIRARRLLNRVLGTR